ncbi:hypothetical protein BDV95DRAFT_601712 [Massariosphaeria phaeospora]|uniref:Uncharacterized protein n=1 Tax=Massariosphaeria phaeospora TaxID=100035 RepID=A0A7C8MMV0_9PLEO|nr:hypothetical protein BDV95DRAFT_601712 [Massariosphaeria phaeospora]
MARKQPSQHSRTPVRSLRSAAAAATPSSSQELAILDDADTDAPLTELDSADVPVPTQYQQTNKDSVEMLLDGQPVFQAPFNYTWLRWSDPALDSCRRIAAPYRTKAWWWKYGVPVLGNYSNVVGESVPATYFICKVCHIHNNNGMAFKFNITNGSKAVLNHYKVHHYRTYREESVNLNVLDRADALDVLDTSDPVQRDVYNRLVENFDPEALRKDILQ